MVDTDIEDRDDPVDDYVGGARPAPELDSEDEIDDDDVDDFTSAPVTGTSLTARIQSVAPSSALQRINSANIVVQMGDADSTL